MVTLDGNKYVLPFDKSIKLMLKTPIYEIYRYSKAKKWTFAVIVAGVNIIQPFNTYKEAKEYAERKYGKTTKQRTGSKSPSKKRNQFLFGKNR